MSLSSTESTGVTLLFGTSANPPTGLEGHAGIVRFLAGLESIPGLGQVDAVWVLPVYRHVFLEKRTMPSFGHRMAMARLAFESLPDIPIGKVSVLPIEQEVAAWTGRDEVSTYEVVELLRKRYPNRRFALVLGADTFLDLLAGRWQHSQALLDTVPVIAVPRPGYPRVQGVPLEMPTLGAVSSSVVRSASDAERRRVLQAEVHAYVTDHDLYGS
jgi:nicotinate (nicotinamide) nucleotide adenylyltransferase